MSHRRVPKFPRARFSPGIHMSFNDQRIMSERQRLLANEFTAQVKTPGGGWMAALSTFVGLKGESRLAMNEVHYSILINACAKADLWDTALLLYSQMRERHLVPNHLTFTHLIAACGGHGDGEFAERAYATMLTHHVKPNTYTSTALVAAFGKAGKWEKSLEVLEDSAENGPNWARANSYTYNAAIDACRRANRWELCVEILRLMEKRAIEPVEYTYNAVLSSLSENQQLDQARQILIEMKSKGFTPNITNDALKNTEATSFSTEAVKEV